MPPIVRFSYAVQVYFAGAVEVHRLTWIFYDAENNEYPGTQDREPATDDDHRAWLQGQADQFSTVTTDEAPL